MVDSAGVKVLPPSGVNAPEKVCRGCGKSMNVEAEICAECGTCERTTVSKAGLLTLTFFFGGIGAHKFYLGKYWQGALYLTFCWTYLPALAALVEFTIYASTSSDRLNEKYFAKHSPSVAFIVAITVLLFVIGGFAGVFFIAEQDMEKRGKSSEGLLMGSQLKRKIEETFSQRPSDMFCTREACPLGVSELGPTKYVRRVYSDRTGLIVIEYDEQLFHKLQNRISITPLIDGKPADLSDPKNAGKSLTWKCGQDKLTTVLPKFLPASCK